MQMCCTGKGAETLNRKLTVPWWHSIKFRLLAFGIIMSILPLTTLGYFNVRAARSNLEETIGRQMTIGVQRLAADLESLIGSELATVATLAKVAGPRLMTEDRTRQEGMLYSLLKEAPSLEEVSLVDVTGQEIARASRRQVVGKDYRNLAHRTCVAQLKAGQDDWYRTFLDIYNQVRLEKPVIIRQKETGEITGGFIVEMSLRGVMNELTKRQPEHQGRIFVVNQQGQLVGHEDFSQVLAQTDVRPSVAVKEFLEGKSGLGVGATRYLGYDGQEVLGVWAPVSSLGWAVVQEIPLKQAFAPVNLLAGQLAMGGVALVLVATSLSIFFGIGFSRSLQRLELGVEEIRKGNLEKPIPIQGNNELSRLGEIINRMGAELHERRQQEQSLWQAEKLSSLGLLASGVAHEVNNPLGIMLAHAQDLQERMKEEDCRELISSGELAEYLDTIVRQTKRCKAITGSLLDFAGHRQREDSKTAVQDDLEATLKLLDFRLRRQGIKLELSLAPALPRAAVPKGETQQVFLNILTNAMDAMPQGGRLLIRGEEEAAHLVFSVTDEGPGIPEGELRKVFDPFYTTKEPGKGTGLGLPISFSIMQRLGGRIELVSSGQGTTVKLYFPINEEEKHAT
jgi:two-component system NtrC family sensor kinase